jgi:hypothetical protein
LRKLDALSGASLCKEQQPVVGKPVGL